MLNALLWIVGAGFAACAVFNVDRGGLRLGALALAAIVCFVIATVGTPLRPSYGTDCRSYSVFASDC